jgi:hypothetical protein
LKQFDKINTSIPIGLEEDLTKRQINSKTFKTGKNSFRTVQVMGALHYVDKGKLKDIDLTPKSVGRNFVIEQTGYTAIIPKNKIAYSFTNHLGKKVKASLKAINGTVLKDLPVVINAVIRADEFIQYDEVLPGLDIFLKITPNGIEWFKTIKNSSAPTKFEWDIEEDSDFGRAVKYKSDGLDKSGEKMEVVSTSSIPNRTIPGKKKFIYTEEFKGRVAGIKNKKLRIKSWSTNISYPLILDAPTTFDIQADADDVGQYITNRAGFLTTYCFWGSSFNAGMRFSSVNIPAGATITSAKLKTTINVANATITGKLRLEDTANASAFSESARQPGDLIVLTKELSITGFTPTGAFTMSGATLSSMVQTIIDKTGWASGQAMAFALIGTGGSAHGSFSEYGHNGQANAPHLELDWTAGLDDITIDLGVFNVTGNSQDLPRDYSATAGLGTFTLTGNSQDLQQDLLSTIDLGTFTLSGLDPALSRQISVDMGLGTFALTGNSVSVFESITLNMSTGSFAVTGNSTGLFLGQKAVVDLGVFTLTGNSLNLTWQHILTTNLGTFTLTGNSAEIGTGISLGIDLGTFTVSGNSIDLFRNYISTIDLGTYVLTGPDVTLVAAGSFSVDFTLGVFTVTGNNSDLVYDRTVIPTLGLFFLTGNSPAMQRAISIDIGLGMYFLTGNSALIAGSRTALDTNLGTFSVTGQFISPFYGRLMSHLLGTYTVNGQSASLYFGNIPVDVNLGVFTVTGNSVVLTRANLLTANLGIYLVSGNTAQIDIGEQFIIELGIFTLSGLSLATTKAALLTAGLGEFVIDTHYVLLNSTGTVGQNYATLVITDALVGGCVVLDAAANNITLTEQEGASTELQIPTDPGSQNGTGGFSDGFGSGFDSGVDTPEESGTDGFDDGFDEGFGL